MVSLGSLWLPIVLGAVLVFVASSVVHMVLKWHNADYFKLANEDEVRAALRKGAPGPGQYVIPHCTDMKQAQSPEMQQKFGEGPVAHLFVRANGMVPIGKALGQWFALSLVVSLLCGYVAAHSLHAGAPAGNVLRIVATIAFMAYGIGAVTEGIWQGKPWRSVGKDLADALLYGFATAIPFAMLWPKATDVLQQILN